MRTGAMRRALRDMAVAMCMACGSASINAAVDPRGGAASVQAEYEEVVVACRKLPPDQSRECIEQAKKKYGELLRSRT